MASMGTAIDLKQIKRFEVTEVYNHPEAKVDVVLVHGLNGDPHDTWTASNGVFWPTELLPVTLKSVKARILVYGYNADVYAFGGGRSPTSDMIYQHAQSLVTNLAMERISEEVTDHPIIFVCHSLGGILVKRALELSNDLTSQHADDNRSIFVSTYGIIFLGTPHTGSNAAAWGLMLESMVHALIPKRIMHSESQLVKTLQTNNETLQNINLHFLDILQKFRICMAHEEMETDFKGTKAFVVDQTSAAPMLPDVVYFGIAANHSNICKFASKNSPGYLNVSTTIKTWIQECPPIIQARWNMERKTRRQQKEAQAKEILEDFSDTPKASSNAPTPDPASVNNSIIMVKSTLSIAPDEEQNPNTPYFIKPSGFRPNSLFVGRKTELAELDKMLFDKKRRADGTSAVLIQSMPGGGKTHLAREFVYEYKDKFPGGIFWLRAKSHTEIAAGFWDIARKAVLKDPSRPATSPNESSLSDPQSFIKLVRKWLNHRRGWLMILDGIHFDDYEGLQKFIPDAPDTSLIYTSTEKSVSGDHHWINPQIMRLPALSAREAQQLLLEELDKKEPFSKDDLKNSMALVQSMGFLPVVIHAVAQRLKTTDEQLGRFARNYASEPRLRGIGAYVAVVDQLKILGAYEALNLMYILCFFSQHIPVEMIHLGLPVLDELRIPVRAIEPVTGSTLNNTFKMLNTFALIDRNEHVESLQSSQSSKGSRDMLADNIDVIRLHSVVQGFFADTLLADKDPECFPRWLSRAVLVFCCSYDMANERITQKTNHGLVEDYRLYEIHGIRLREHVTRHVKKMPLAEAYGELEKRLAFIKIEIERRTPESAHFIAGGRPDALTLTSIFDRTSSSSDAETPAYELNNRSSYSTFGLEPDKSQVESPQSTINPAVEYRRPLQTIPARNQFLPMPALEDPGYDSDREGSVAMTIQPSQRTIVQDPRSPISPGGEWETVKPRRTKAKPGRLDLRNHRTTRDLEKQRYSDSAGAFRAIGAVDPRAINPRLSVTTANGFVQNSPSREQSRGRLSGHSHAEVALAHISKNSPPPARGSGMIMDRRSSSQMASDKSRMMTGTPSYAAAVSGSTKDTASGFKEPVPELESSNESTSSLDIQRQSMAKESLQRFPIEVHPAPPQTSYTPMPPYPQTPAIEYDQPFTYTTTHENLRPSTVPSNSTIYPARTGPIPFESHHSHSSSQLKRDHPHDYQQPYSESLPSSFHQAQDPTFLSLSTPSLPRHEKINELYIPGHPEFATHGGYTSQPMSRDQSGQSRHSEHSNSHLSTYDSDGGEDVKGRRRPSFAKTEPAPNLPIFSPRIPPTSYQVYERMRGQLDRDNEIADEGLRRKSPRLEFARVAERFEWGNRSDGIDENIPQQQQRGRRTFNPNAPSFEPSMSGGFGYGGGSYNYSPNLPPAPQNSMFSNQSNLSSNTTSAYPSPYPNAPPNSTFSNLSNSNQTSAYPSPYPFAPPNSTFSNPSNQNSNYPSPNQRAVNTSPQAQSQAQTQQQYRTSPHSLHSPFTTPPVNFTTNSTPRSQLRQAPDFPQDNTTFSDAETLHDSPRVAQNGTQGGEEMGRIPSGGIRLAGGRFIEFGEMGMGLVIDAEEARGRAERGRVERGRERERGNGEGEWGLGISGVKRS